MAAYIYPTIRCPSTEQFKVMNVAMKHFLLIMLIVASITGLHGVNGVGECGRVPADRVALQMAPCATAAKDVKAKVSPSCCAAVKKLGQNPRCLCAVMLSDTAKHAGIKPAVAMTIPKRCNLAKRPVGYKCGGYTLPSVIV